MKERKTPGHVRDRLINDTLQWGRSGEGAEDGRPGAVSIGDCTASMGPLR